MRVYNCLVLNDYPEKHYASWVADQKKKIETRGKTFKYRGDLIICCGAKSVTRNAGLALCMVNLWYASPMQESDEKEAMIECAPGRVSHFLKDWRYFNRKFSFSKCRVSGAFQSIFQIVLPDDVKILEPKKQ